MNVRLSHQAFDLARDIKYLIATLEKFVIAKNICMNARLFTMFSRTPLAALATTGLVVGSDFIGTTT